MGAWKPAPRAADEMKLLLFAHTPPPHHVQSYMVQLMLEGLGGDHRGRHRSVAPSSMISALGIECYHVNARLSQKLEDIGDFRAVKLLRLFGYCLQAIWCRFRYGVTNLYYVPAPGKRFAVYRDWMVMLFCRPFFKKIILHWHAAGLGKWLETVVSRRTRALTYKFMGQVDNSIVLSPCNRGDAEKLLPHRVAVVGNGIPDPCPEFETQLLPRRQKRQAVRASLLAGKQLSPAELEGAGEQPHVFRVLFLAHCIREKGLFDALEGVALANQKLARENAPVRVHLTVAGSFVNPEEQAEFERRCTAADFRGGASTNGRQFPERLVSYAGFAGGEIKARLLEESDCMCFPTYYYAESFGLVVIEAMAFGMPVITSRWRSLPGIMMPDRPGLVDVRQPGQIAEELLRLMLESEFIALRQHFLAHFTIEKHLQRLAAELRMIDEEPQAATGQVFEVSATR